jgi:hypothetical protein
MIGKRIGGMLPSSPSFLDEKKRTLKESAAKCILPARIIARDADRKYTKPLDRQR